MAHVGVSQNGVFEEGQHKFYIFTGFVRTRPTVNPHVGFKFLIQVVGTWPWVEVFKPTVGVERRTHTGESNGKCMKCQLGLHGSL